MIRTLFALQLLLAATGHASPDPDSPLALTGQAASANALTPSAADQALSDLYLNKGLDCLKLGHANAAVQALLDSVRLAPGADNTKALGTAYYQVGNPAKAAWAYQQSLQWRPDERVKSLLAQLQAQVHAAAALGGVPGAAPAPSPIPTAVPAAAAFPAPSAVPAASPVPAPKADDAARPKTPDSRGNEAPK